MLHYSSDINNRLPSPNQITSKLFWTQSHCAMCIMTEFIALFLSNCNLTTRILLKLHTYIWTGYALWLSGQLIVVVCATDRKQITLWSNFSLQEDAKLQLFLFIFLPKNLTKCTFAVGPWYVHLFIRALSIYMLHSFVYFITLADVVCAMCTLNKLPAYIAHSVSLCLSITATLRKRWCCYCPALSYFVKCFTSISTICYFFPAGRNDMRWQ